MSDTETARNRARHLGRNKLFIKTRALQVPKEQKHGNRKKGAYRVHEVPHLTGLKQQVFGRTPSMKRGTSQVSGERKLGLRTRGHKELRKRPGPTRSGGARLGIRRRL